MCRVKPLPGWGHLQRTRGSRQGGPYDRVVVAKSISLAFWECRPHQGFSSLTFLSCSQSGEWFRDASLAKFGYILDMKVKKEIESFYIFLATY
jgi:hypothetical protein